MKSLQSTLSAAPPIVGLSLLMGVAFPLAAAPNGKDWNPTCREIVAMGYDQYQAAYEAHGGDLSTLGMKMSAARYTDCKANDNYRRASKLNLARRQVVLNARTALHEFESALWMMVEIRAGGGTMYGVFNASSAALGEDVIGQVIGTAQRARRSVQARRKANADFTLATRQLAPNLRTPTQSDDAVMDAQAQRQYRDSARTAAAMRSRLQTLAARLPDEAAAILAARVAYDARHTFESP